jgi:hypothetical protein
MFLPQGALLVLVADGMKRRPWTKRGPISKFIFTAAHIQNKQIQGESAATYGYHAANAAVGQTEDQMTDSRMWALADLETSTSAYGGAVATFTGANTRLASQLEERSKEVKEVKELLKKERAERGGRRTFPTRL